MTQPKWESKIVRYADVSPLDLVANPLNARLHPQVQQVNMSAILQDVGFIAPIIVNETTGLIVDGHLRVTLAIRDGIETIPVAYVSLSKDEEIIALASFDELGVQAIRDREKLEEQLRLISTDNPDIAAMFDVMAIKAGIVAEQSVDDLWQGMPEFEQDDKLGWKTIKVHFENEDDYNAFIRLVDQPMTEKTKYIWYPELEKESMLAYRCEDES